MATIPASGPVTPEQFTSQLLELLGRLTEDRLTLTLEYGTRLVQVVVRPVGELLPKAMTEAERAEHSRRVFEAKTKVDAILRSGDEKAIRRIEEYLESKSVPPLLPPSPPKGTKP